MISQHRDGDVAVIEIDRHERRNALDVAHCDGLGAAVREQAAGGARAVVITGAGSSAMRCTRCSPLSRGRPCR